MGSEVHLSVTRFADISPEPTVSVTGSALTVDVPVADRSKVYVSVVLPVFAGTETVSFTVPFVQGNVEGSPATKGLEENMQVLALATWADKETEPPAESRVDGVTANDVSVGG